MTSKPAMQQSESLNKDKAEPDMITKQNYLIATTNSDRLSNKQNNTKAVKLLHVVLVDKVHRAKQRVSEVYIYDVKMQTSMPQIAFRLTEMVVI